MPSSPFGDDDGSADDRLADALAAFARGQGGSADVLAALAVCRLLVPVVAVASDETESDEPAAGANVPDDESGQASPKGGGGHADMATVLTTGRDGRRGLLAFTSVDTMRRWNPQARPSPVPTRTAAEAALADGADALVIDLAGPVVFSVDARDLRTLASGWRPLGQWSGVGSADPVRDAPSRRDGAVRGVRGIRSTGGRVWRGVRRRVRRALTR